MPSNNSSKKRLFKNTLFLYVRSFLTMIIGLYTSRLVLDILGVEDYGIFNIVGGFVVFFSIVSNTLVATTQRFITVELGKKENSNPRKTFSAAMVIHIFIFIILLFLFETIGLWVLNNKLNIPSERFFAANWVFQFSVVSFLISILSSPYTAVIIAYERMKAFAFISLFDVFVKLLFVLLLYLIPFDRLIFYSFFVLLISITDRIIYSYYCSKHFELTKIIIVKDKQTYKEMISFSGMNFLGSFASIASNQGLDIILNVFFGVRINAARGIANQVLSAVSKFVNDFMTALDPQITKEYSSGNKLASQTLCFMGAKYSFFLMFLMGAPLIFKAPYILKLWLNYYPEYTVIFVRLALILSFFTVLSRPLVIEILATGNLKKTVLWIGCSILTSVPMTLLLFVLGFGPEYCYFILIIVEFLSLNIRLIILEKISGIAFFSAFYKEVFLRASLITIILFIVNSRLNNYIGDSIWGLFIYIIVSILVGVIVIYSLGLKSLEKNALKKYLISKNGNRNFDIS